MIEKRFIDLIASEERVSPDQVEAAIGLLNRGATVSFVMRYRKDRTQGLSESKLERIAERNKDYTSLSSKKVSLIRNLEKQNEGEENKGTVSDEIRAAIEACDDHIKLEDVSLPYKKQRNNHAAIAAAKGLLPLANYVWAQAPSTPPPPLYAESFISAEHQIFSAEEALEGAKHILAECIAMNTDVRQQVRQALSEEGRLCVHPTRVEMEKNSKYAPYKDLNLPIGEVGHEALLTILRGEWEAALRVEVVIDDEKLITQITDRFVQDKESPYAFELSGAINDAYRRLLRPAIEVEVIAQVRRKAEDALIDNCREHVRNMLLSPPAGEVPVIGVCSWSPTKCTLALVNESGVPVEMRTVEETEAQKLEAALENTIAELVALTPDAGIAVSSGPGGRDILRAVQAWIKKTGKDRSYVTLVVDSGLAAYASSPLAEDELAGIEEALRAAVSIGRRHQDPLKELIKLDPIMLVPHRMSFGINRRRLIAGIVKTIESAVNRIGLDVNTASAEMLRYISGLQFGLAQAIVEARKERNGFTNRQQLREVSGIDTFTFQQCAGFLRILSGEELLDATSIHPEAYEAVKKISESLALSIEEITRSTERLNDIRLEDFVDGDVGVMTLEDICYELGRAGRDPRKRFKPPVRLIPLNTIQDLQPGMVLEGLITNVADFGVFVSLGLPEEGLIHRSEMGWSAIKALKTAIQVGEVIKVQIKDVNQEQGKIALTIRDVARMPLSRPAFRDRAGGQDRDRYPRGRRSGQFEPGGADRPRRRRSKGDIAIPRQQQEGRKKEDSLVNTTLAEQLAALRDKIISS
ncbi:MAG: S1 RNA-binding domain-containing protein [Candidatus Hydrogenedens sp.]|nr:S1 RNA-binding domain-containing protein [Candidatus Hydrogenedens sp.]